MNFSKYMFNQFGILYEDKGSFGLGEMVMVPVDFSRYSSNDLNLLRELNFNEIASLIGSFANKSRFPSFLEEELLTYLFVNRGEYIDIISQDTINKIRANAHDLDSIDTHIPNKAIIKTSLDDLFESKKSTTFTNRNELKDDFNFDFEREKSILNGISIEGINSEKLSGSYMVYANKIIEHFNFEGVPIILKAGYNGKGFNEIQAFFSFMFEAFERHYSFPNDELIKNYSDNELMYTKLNDSNSHIHRFEYRFDRIKHDIASLIAEDGKLVPAENVFYLFPSSKSPFLYLSVGQSYKGTSSTGLCSGKNPEEAKIQGISEVIEHYSQMKNKAVTFKINPDSVSDENLKEIIIKHDPVIVKYENELNYPVFGAYVHKMSGYGAHLNGSIAISRALSELMNSIRDYPMKDFQFLERKNLEDCIENYSTGNNKGDLLRINRLFEKNDINPIYVNLKNNDSNVFVYKVIIPELFRRTRDEVLKEFNR